MNVPVPPALDGKRVLVGSFRGLVEELDLANGEKIRALPTNAKDKKVSGLAYIDNDKKAVVAHGGAGLRVWGLQKGNVECVLSEAIPEHVAVSPDGRLVAGGWSTIRLWNWKTGEEVAKSPGYELSTLRFAFSPDSRFIALSGGRNSKAWKTPRLAHNGIIEDRALLIWDLTTYQISGILAYPSPEQGRK